MNLLGFCVWSTLLLVLANDVLSEIIPGAAVQSFDQMNIDTSHVTKTVLLITQQRKALTAFFYISFTLQNKNEHQDPGTRATSIDRPSVAGNLLPKYSKRVNEELRVSGSVAMAGDASIGVNSGGDDGGMYQPAGGSGGTEAMSVVKASSETSTHPSLGQTYRGPRVMTGRKPSGASRGGTWDHNLKGRPLLAAVFATAWLLVAP